MGNKYQRENGRDYNTEKAEGSVQKRVWRTATIEREGVIKVKLHTGRFGESADNNVMIDRQEKNLKGQVNQRNGV